MKKVKKDILNKEFLYYYAVYLLHSIFLLGHLPCLSLRSFSTEKRNFDKQIKPPAMRVVGRALAMCKKTSNDII